MEGEFKVWVTFRPELAAIGKRVASFPDHRGEVKEGVITELSDRVITVDYLRYGNCRLLRETGRLLGKRVDCSLDIGLIEG